MTIKIDGYKAYNLDALFDTGGECSLARKYAIPEDLWKQDKTSLTFNTEKSVSTLSAEVPFLIGDNIILFKLIQHEMASYDLMIGYDNLQKLRPCNISESNHLQLGQMNFPLKHSYHSIIPLFSIRRMLIWMK